MPTLFRFFSFLVILGGLGFGAVMALATLVEPETREMVVAVPAARLAR